jgi:hypothetical protein
MARRGGRTAAKAGTNESQAVHVLPLVVKRGWVVEEGRREA